MYFVKTIRKILNLRIKQNYMYINIYKCMKCELQTITHMANVSGQLVIFTSQFKQYGEL